MSVTIRRHGRDLEDQMVSGSERRCRLSRKVSVFLVLLWICIGVGVGAGLAVKFAMD